LHPVIIADDLSLPFTRRLEWADFSLRFSQREALADPRKIVATLRQMSEEKVRNLQAAVLRVRPNFLWHLDPSRPSAVDQILHDMCAAGDPK